MSHLHRGTSLSPTATYEDGSPRYDHGHEPVTGETWWETDDSVGTTRHCQACGHDHPVGTTCAQCEPCEALDLMPQAEEVFRDLLPGGAGAQVALARHNESLRRHARCDGGCGVPDCRRPYLDEAGLTRCQSDDREIRKES